MTLLGEGETPIIESNHREKLYYKHEGLNPGGSFKDRGSAKIVEKASKKGVDTLHIVSSGNAALSLALYSKLQGIKCVCHVPNTTSEEKKCLIETLGGELEIYPGMYEDIYHKVEDKELEGDNITSGVSDTAIDAYTDIAEEILSSGVEPDNVVIPCGNGTGLAGIWKGFKQKGREPDMIGVQIEGAAPIKKALDEGTEHAVIEDPPESRAEGIVASESFHCEAAVDAVKESGGDIKTVSEHQIQEGLDNLLSEGVLCEPTSAVVKPVADELQGVTVAVITGSGLKYFRTLDKLLAG